MPAEVKIYTRKWCGYCTAAERLLTSKGVAYENIDCTGDRAKRDWLAEVTGSTTEPASSTSCSLAPRRADVRTRFRRARTRAPGAVAGSAERGHARWASAGWG